MSDQRYWSYTPDYVDVELHETVKDARETCEAAIDRHRDHAVDGWDENVSLICWGVVVECAAEGARVHHLDGCDKDVCTEGCPVAGHPWDYLTDYQLRPVTVPTLPEGWTRWIEGEAKGWDVAAIDKHGNVVALDAVLDLVHTFRTRTETHVPYAAPIDVIFALHAIAQAEAVDHE